MGFADIFQQQNTIKWDCVAYHHSCGRVASIQITPSMLQAWILFPGLTDAKVKARAQEIVRIVVVAGITYRIMEMKSCHVLIPSVPIKTRSR